jgi:hypothetical protein
MALLKPPVPTLVIPASLCDEFGDLTQLRDQFAPTQSRYNKCREQIAALVKDEDPEAEFRVEGERYRVMIGSRALERRVDIAAARKALGAQKFIEVATVTLKSLEAYLLRPQIEALCLTERTGSRTYSPVPINRVVGL